ncbi:o-succinylbenzoate synthase [Prevotella nigrescens]|uniref:o-succinylbenzoate synthase n=1 Tax=Prevotella nigrescens TaxID=28133 RepID=UPI00288005F7|nr:o-succinylbenzoate synthase [Prevotella nigrescens]
MRKITITSKLLHFLQPAGTSRGVYNTRLSFYLKLTSDEQPDVVGVGECATLPDLSCDAMPPNEYERKLRTFCDEYERTGVIDYEAMRAYPSMLFGLETAVAQLNAKGSLNFFDTPFGRGEEGIPINGLVWMGTFEEMFECLEAKLKAGFRCIKIKIGAIDFDQELQLIRHIRSTFSRNDVELRVDANGGFTPEEALSRMEALVQYDIHSIEQPIKQNQRTEMARLCAATPLPIGLDEELIGVNERQKKIELLDIIRPQYIVLKPSLHGGMAGTEEWIQLACERNIGSWITSALESNVGLNAIAQLTASIYGTNIRHAQGLGTGQLFADNIEMPLKVVGDKLWTMQ